ncbi:DUF2786 domain-containing protein, partial [Streptomyces sp. NPDC005907]|uniref:DUF2786 domain-containing protein n=1 Tax=Streptomyces sp. NPDC005907 TaxID=3154571 RepID=UPI0033EE4097
MTSSTPGTVERAFEALYADTDAALDTGASLLAADPACDAELTRRGEEFVAAAWRRGWQPADVVRMVRRRLDDVHVRLVAELIVAQSKRREEAGRGPRWAAQLDDLADEARAPRTDRFSYATAVLELYRLLLRLPSIEPLDTPREGAPRDAGRASQDSRMLGRIRALLAKAEATGFPEEAEALSAKAQELMARHSIDEALLAARTHAKDAPGACRIGIEAPYETAKAVLLDAVARANRCRAVWNDDLGFSTVVGFEADLEAVELLHTSLLVQATTAMTRAEAAQRAGGRKRTKTFRQSFLAAYAHRIGDRLAAAAEGQVADSAGELLPVLAARDVAVADRVDDMFPRTVTTRLRGVTDATLSVNTSDRTGERC